MHPTKMEGFNNKRSQGNWKIGITGGTVVTDNSEGFPPNGMGHDDTEYYGGYLIAESILKKADAELIADAGTTANKCGLLPSEILKQRDELLEACKAAKIDTEMLLDETADFTRENLQSTIDLLDRAIKNATV